MHVPGTRVQHWSLSGAAFVGDAATIGNVACPTRAARLERLRDALPMLAQTGFVAASKPFDRDVRARVAPCVRLVDRMSRASMAGRIAIARTRLRWSSPARHGVDVRSPQSPSRQTSMRPRPRRRYNVRRSDLHSRFAERIFGSISTHRICGEQQFALERSEVVGDRVDVQMERATD